MLWCGVEEYEDEPIREPFFGDPSEDLDTGEEEEEEEEDDEEELLQ